MYDYFQRLWENREKAVAAGLGIAFLLLAVACFAYVLGLRNSSTAAGTDIHDNGNAAQGIRDEIGSARSDIGTAKSGIDNATATAGRIEERISDAQERAGYIQGTADEGRRIIAECQSILREVRAGGKTGTLKN